MPLTTDILAGALIYNLFTSAALIILIFIALIFIFLIVPLLVQLDLKKKDQLIEGKLRTSWLVVSASGDLMSNEKGIRGELWVSLLGIRLAKREIYAQSLGDLFAAISGKNKDKNRAKAKAEQERINHIDEDKEDVEGTTERADRRDKEGEGKKEEVRQDSREESKEAESKRKSPRRMPRPGSILAAVPSLYQFIKDTMKSADFKTLCCRLGIGLYDPSQTAILSGRLWSVASALRYHGADIHIEPSFEEEKLDGELLADIRIRLLYIVAAIVSVLREKEIRSLIKEVMGWGQ